MGKVKAYAVIVGRQIGVFEEWTVVQPLVTGVPGGLQKGYQTVAEAQRAFANAQTDGTARVVDPDAPLNPNERRQHGHAPAYANHYDYGAMARQLGAIGVAPVVPNSPSNTASRSRHSDTTSVSGTARTRASSATSASRSHHSAPSSTTTTSPKSKSSTSTPLTRSSSEPSASEIRLQAIQAALDQPGSSSSGGVKARAPPPPASSSKKLPSAATSASKSRSGGTGSYGAKASTSPGNELSSLSKDESKWKGKGKERSTEKAPPPRSPSPTSSIGSPRSSTVIPQQSYSLGSLEQHSRDERPAKVRAVCRTPSWLDDDSSSTRTRSPSPCPTPASSGLLSPLNSEDMPLPAMLRHLQDEISQVASPKAVSNANTPTRSVASPASKKSAPPTPSVAKDSPKVTRNGFGKMPPGVPHSYNASDLAMPQTPRSTYNSPSVHSPTKKYILRTVVNGDQGESATPRKAHLASLSSTPVNSPVVHDSPALTQSTPSTPRRRVKLSPAASESVVASNSNSPSNPSSSTTGSRTPNPPASDFSTIHQDTPQRARGVHQRVIQHEEDPRSPIQHPLRVPEIMCVSFARPTPPSFSAPLPVADPESPFASASSPTANSLLFKSSHSSPRSR